MAITTCLTNPEHVHLSYKLPGYLARQISEERRAAVVILGNKQPSVPRQVRSKENWVRKCLMNMTSCPVLIVLPLAR